MFTREDESIIRDQIAADAPEVSHRLVAYNRLPKGEAFCLTSWFSNQGEEDLVMPASHDEQRTLIISSEDPGATGRPVRFITQSNPKDGDMLCAWELGGYWATTAESNISRSFTRKTVLSRQKKLGS
jgi:hypothetical protein